MCGSRLAGQAAPGTGVLAWSQVAVGFAGCIAFEAADDLELGQSFFRPPGDVGPGGRVRAHPRDHDPPQGVVGLTVAAAVQPVPVLGFARVRRDGSGGAQVRPGGFGAEPVGVVAGRDEQHGGGVRADAEQAEQARARAVTSGTISWSSRVSWSSRYWARRPSSRSESRVW